MSIEANKQLVRRLIEEVWNQRNLEQYDELLAPTFVNHGSEPQGGSELEGQKKATAMLIAAFPDLHVTIEDMIGEADKVMSRLVIRGTHQGTFLGIAPTGRQIETSIFNVLRVRDGQFVERWGIVDMVGMLQQLGVSILS
jgi:predicted ester cyclase